MRSVRSVRPVRPVRPALLMPSMQTNIFTDGSFRPYRCSWKYITRNTSHLWSVTGLCLSNENTIGPAVGLLSLVVREASEGALVKR